VENPGRERAPFDRQAALDELERFGREIERYRAQREALGDEFETFVRSFKTPPERGADNQPSGPLTRVVPRVPAAALPPPPVTAAPTPPPIVPVTPVSTAAASPEAAAVSSVATEPAPRRETSFGSPAVAAGAVLAVLAGGLLVAMLWNRAPESTSPAPAAVEPPAAAPAPSAEPTPPAAPAASPAEATSESAITTVRRVWMRVVVDGERVLEREVPAGTRVPLKAEKTIVIRTGDAGAVRLSMRGADRGFLGVEGEVVTRSFTVPPRPAPAGR
jgi:hypothetical protein